MPSFKILGCLVLEKKIFKDFGPVGHVGNVTETVYISFCFPILRMHMLRAGKTNPSRRTGGSPLEHLVPGHKKKKKKKKKKKIRMHHTKFKYDWPNGCLNNVNNNDDESMPIL